MSSLTKLLPPQTGSKFLVLYIRHQHHIIFIPLTECIVKCKGAPGIEAMTQGRGGGGALECLNKFSSHFSKIDF